MSAYNDDMDEEGSWEDLCTLPSLPPAGSAASSAAVRGLALEGYRARLSAILSLVDAAARGAVALPCNEADLLQFFDQLLDYFLTGEAALLRARAGAPSRAEALAAATLASTRAAAAAEARTGALLAQALAAAAGRAGARLAACADTADALRAGSDGARVSLADLAAAAEAAAAAARAPTPSASEADALFPHALPWPSQGEARASTTFAMQEAAIRAKSSVGLAPLPGLAGAAGGIIGSVSGSPQPVAVGALQLQDEDSWVPLDAWLAPPEAATALPVAPPEVASTEAATSAGGAAAPWTNLPQAVSSSAAAPVAPPLLHAPWQTAPAPVPERMLAEASAPAALPPKLPTVAPQVPSQPPPISLQQQQQPPKQPQTQPPRAVGGMELLASLTPALRKQLLGYLPRGWKPGDPLPPSMPDIRALIAQAQQTQPPAR